MFKNTGKNIVTLVTFAALLMPGCKEKKEDHSAAMLAMLISSQNYHLLNRVAIIPGVGTEAGNEALAQSLAEKIVTYTRNIDDITAHGFKDNWVPAGDFATTMTAAQMIPLFPTGSTVADTGADKNIRFIEFCNPTYALEAMNTGIRHSPALPCKSAIWVDHAKNVIYLDIPDPVAVFRMFFNDLTAAEKEIMMKNPDIAKIVGSEMLVIVKAALGDVPNVSWVSIPVAGTLVSDADAVGTKKPFRLFKYANTGTALTSASYAFTNLDNLATIGNAVLTKLGSTITPGNATGLSVSGADAWRSARFIPAGGARLLALPPNKLTLVIEAYSPKYAKAALLGHEWRGVFYPYKIGVYVEGGHLFVSISNPVFLEKFWGTANDSAVMFDDLKKIVDQGITASGVAVSAGVEQ